MHKIKSSHPDIKFYFYLLIYSNIVNGLYIYELLERIAINYVYSCGQNKFPVMRILIAWGLWESKPLIQSTAEYPILLSSRMRWKIILVFWKRKDEISPAFWRFSTTIETPDPRRQRFVSSDIFVWPYPRSLSWSWFPQTWQCLVKGHIMYSCSFIYIPVTTFVYSQTFPLSVYPLC